jgi:RNA polymerase sigma-70 factor (ECF subfamily)
MISVAVPDGIILSETELERLVDQYGDGLLRTCLLYLRDYGLAEDAVQETFLRAYRSWNQFEGRSSEKTWLTAIAINVCRTMLRSPWRRRVNGEEALELLRSEDPSMPDPTVARAVMRLPKDQRVCIILFYVQEMKIREIAQALEVPQATVSSRLNRARKKLRAELKEWYFDEE